ncbi:MAG: hypothetical protein JXA36_06405 [Coriobacteriia bacterium]|nr:hypothetical protein [Coriobacteriia bacterium]
MQGLIGGFTKAYCCLPRIVALNTISLLYLPPPEDSGSLGRILVLAANVVRILLVIGTCAYFGMRHRRRESVVLYVAGVCLVVLCLHPLVAPGSTRYPVLLLPSMAAVCGAGLAEYLGSNTRHGLAARCRTGM